MENDPIRTQGEKARQWRKSIDKHLAKLSPEQLSLFENSPTLRPLRAFGPPGNAAGWNEAIRASLELTNEEILDLILDVFRESKVVLPTLEIEFSDLDFVHVSLRQFFKAIEKTQVKVAVVACASFAQREVPSNIESLVNLEVLQLYGCSFYEPSHYFAAVSKLGALKTLRVDRCRFKGPFEFSGLLDNPHLLALEFHSSSLVRTQPIGALQSDLAKKAALHPALESLQVNGLGLSEVVDLLHELKENKRLKTLDCPIAYTVQQADISLVCRRMTELLETNDCLTKVRFRFGAHYAIFFSDQQNLAVFEALAKNRTIKTFDFELPCVSAACLAALAPSRCLQSLGVRVAFDGAIVANAMHLVVAGPKLSELKIHGRNFSDQDTATVAAAILQASEFRTLDLSGCAIGRRNFRKLYDAVSKSTSVSRFFHHPLAPVPKTLRHLRRNTTLTLLGWSDKQHDPKTRRILEFNRRLSQDTERMNALTAGFAQLARSLGLPAEMGQEILEMLPIGGFSNLPNLKAAMRVKQVNRATAGLPALTAPPRPDSAWRRELDKLIEPVRLFQLNRLAAQGVDLDILLNGDRPGNDDHKAWVKLVAAAVCVSNPALLDHVLKALPLALTRLGIKASLAQAIKDPLQIDVAVLRAVIDRLKCPALKLVGVALSPEWLEGLGFDGRTTLTSLRISGRLSEATCQALAGLMTSAPKLTTLHLHKCRFNSRKLRVLAEGLRKTTTLKVLDLSGNRLAPHHETLLVDAIKANRSLAEFIAWTNAPEGIDLKSIRGTGSKK